MRGGKPYRGIGVNYFDVFYRKLKSPDDTSYRDGLKVLADYRIPFARFMAGGFWPSENKLYFENKKEYFCLLDEVVKAAKEEGIGLIPSFFWASSTVPDLVKEPTSAWGDPKSKTHQFMRQYVRELVTRYRSSPAIWGWEFGNEYNLGADLPNASEHRPPVVPELGTPTVRSEKDELTHAMIRTAFREFAREVRKHDKNRIIVSGNGFPRASAWHQLKERSWKEDTKDQYAGMLAGDNPDPMDTLCVHLYPGEESRFGAPVTAESLLKESMAIASKVKKPLFVGEFGANNEKGQEAGRKQFMELLAAIEKTRVPLAALWVYDFGGQDEVWNVSAKDDRSYQLQAISEANRRMK